MRTPLLVLCLALATLAEASEKVRRTPQCTADVDCVVTDFAGCCGGCCPMTRGIPKKQLAQEQARCASIDCETLVCAQVVCEEVPRVDSLQARCVDQRCVSVPKEAPPSTECREDRECTVRYPAAAAHAPCRSSPCGCCPGTVPVAEPVAKAEHAGARPGNGQKAGPSGSPGYGLSQGKPSAPRVNCSPCPGPTPARAVCRQNRCALELAR
jgi:hypothetical protein